MSTHFNAYVPLKGQDQDAPPVANDKFLIACDGLGANGSANHRFGPNGEVEKSAYLGSRKVSEICARFFEENYEELLSNNSLPGCVQALKVKIQTGLTEYLSVCPKVGDSTGGTTFPTTLASVVYREEPDCINATVIWAGDSRVYMVTEQSWLQQLTRDDVIGEFDACFGKDCRMSNCIGQDEAFSINYASYKLPKRCVIFTCSDGCFDFTSSPMFFEWKILNALYDAKLYDFDSLKNSFENVLRGMKCGDDCTLAGAMFGYETAELREPIGVRVKQTLQPLMSEFTNANMTYEKITGKRKAEIRSLMSDKKKLSQKIAIQQKKLVLAAFKEEIIDKSEALKDKSMLAFSSSLRSAYPPYADFFVKLEEYSENVKYSQKIEKDYEIAYGRLKELVDFAEREKRFKDKKERLTRGGIYGVGQQIISTFGPKVAVTIPQDLVGDKISDCRMYIGELEKVFSFINQDPASNCNRGTAENVKSLTNKLLFGMIEVENLIAQQAQAEEEEKANILTQAELSRQVMPSVMTDGVTKYGSYLDTNAYSELLAAYAEAKRLKDIDNSIDPADRKEKTFDELVEEFQNFLKVHSFKLSECLSGFEELENYVPAIKQQREVCEKLNAMQDDLQSGQNAQKQVWLKYKNVYEFYKTCPYTGRV